MKTITIQISALEADALEACLQERTCEADRRDRDAVLCRILRAYITAPALPLTPGFSPVRARQTKGRP